MKKQTSAQQGQVKVSRLPSRRQIFRCWELYVFLLAPVVLIFLFGYVPMYGIQLAFKDFKAGLSIAEQPWVGLKHFKRLANLPNLKRLVVNTVRISLFSAIFTFPFPIFLALLLDETRSRKFGKLVQSVTYFPHLISLVVVMSLFRVLCNPRSGLINIIIRMLGGGAIDFFAEPDWVTPIWIISSIWQNTGYGAIVYVAALAGVDQEQIDAARVDGCSRFMVTRYIKLPAIMPTIITMEILHLGQLFSVGADKMLLITNNMNIAKSDILSVYVYQVGLVQGQFGFGTAVGLVNMAVNILCLLVANGLARKYSETSLF